jgi:hypothetical protein
MTRKFGDREERRPRRTEVTARRGKTVKEQMDAGIAKANRKARARPKAKKPTGLMKGAIEGKIDELREKEKWSFRERHGKTDFHEYLKDVYSLRRWAKRRAKQVAALYDIQVRKRMTPIRIIIDASSEEEDRRVKGRWKRAIEYAEAMKVRASEFIELLDNNGGVQGCADKMAALEKERTKLKSKRDRW